jgi:hypothetical protein
MTLLHSGMFGKREILDMALVLEYLPKQGKINFKIEILLPTPA